LPSLAHFPPQAFLPVSSQASQFAMLAPVILVRYNELVAPSWHLSNL
jgi:hypothetical protein